MPCQNLQPVPTPSTCPATKGNIIISVSLQNPITTTKPVSPTFFCSQIILNVFLILESSELYFCLVFDVIVAVYWGGNLNV